MVEHMFRCPWKTEIPQRDPQGWAGKVSACGFRHVALEVDQGLDWGRWQPLNASLP